MRHLSAVIRFNALCVSLLLSLLVFGDTALCSPSGPIRVVGFRDKEFPTTDGELISLSDFEGSVVLLHFLASWCGPCAIEAPSLSELSRSFGGRRFVVIGVAIDDTPSSARGFAEKLRIPFPVIVDTTGALKRAFGAQGLPMTVVLNASGDQISFQDPATGSSTRRIVGPRDWRSPSARASIEKLLVSEFSEAGAA